jgi:hypothetical protein
VPASCCLVTPEGIEYGPLLHHGTTLAAPLGMCGQRGGSQPGTSPTEANPGVGNGSLLLLVFGSVREPGAKRCPTSDRSHEPLSHPKPLTSRAGDTNWPRCAEPAGSGCQGFGRGISKLHAGFDGARPPGDLTARSLDVLSLSKDRRLWASHWLGMTRGILHYHLGRLPINPGQPSRPFPLHLRRSPRWHDPCNWRQGGRGNTSPCSVLSSQYRRARDVFPRQGTSV